MKFTSLYFGNLLNLLGLGTLNTNSILPTSVEISATGTTSLGYYILADESDDPFMTTSGLLTTSFGTSVSMAANNAYNQTKSDLEMTQAYFESMNEEELSEFIAKLESKNIEITIDDEPVQKSLKG